MTENERMAQLKTLADETLRKLDAVANDSSAMRTAQLRTMQAVAGNTQILGFILDRQDEMKKEFNASIDALRLEFAEDKQAQDAKMEAIMRALRQLLHRP